MIKNLFEGADDGRDNKKRGGSYQQYREQGGIIDKKNYESILAKTKSAAEANPIAITDDIARGIAKAKDIARYAGIALHSTQDTLDPLLILFGVLYAERGPEEVKHHHDQMSDQRIFAEALHMSGKTELLDKLIRAYPNISFDYRTKE